MEIEKYNNIIEQLNKEYISIQYSKEYRLGKRIYKLVNAIKQMNIKDIIEYYKSLKKQKKIKAISQNTLMTETYYEKRKIDKDYKCVVYSCITGNYDGIQEPIVSNNDFTLITDCQKTNENSSWKFLKIPEKIKSLKGNKINRYCKMHPFEFFDEYDFSIYVDGNVQIISDVRSICEIARESKCGIAMHKHPNRSCAYVEANVCKIAKRGNIDNINSQMTKYRKDGFPENYGFCEATIIVCDLKNEIAKKIMSDWYDEFIRSDSGRDQLAFPYVLWKNNYEIKDIGILGNNLLFNPIFRITNIGSHKS